MNWKAARKTLQYAEMAKAKKLRIDSCEGRCENDKRKQIAINITYNKQARSFNICRLFSSYANSHVIWMYVLSGGPGHYLQSSKAVNQIF